MNNINKTNKINKINNIDNKILGGDCLAVLPRLPENYFDGAIFSPPYNFGPDPNHGKGEMYGRYSDTMSKESYIMMMGDVFWELERLIKPNGTVCMNINYNSDNPMLPYELIYHIINVTCWRIVESIGWVKNSSTPLQTSPRNLSRKMELILVFARKEEMNTFTTNKPKGEINEKTGQQFYKKTDNVIFAKNNDSHPNAPTHRATYSRELVRKLIDIYYPKGSRILDPFAGLGTTVVSAKQHGRIGVGIEVDTAYVEYANRSLSQTSLEEYI